MAQFVNHPSTQPTVVGTVNDMLSWEKALSYSKTEERRVFEFTQQPIQSVVRQARTGDLGALNFLLRHTAMKIMATRSIKTCTQINHFGKNCEGLFCDGAVASCIEHAADKVFGASANLFEEPQRSIAMKLQLDDRHAEEIKLNHEQEKATNKSVLTYWDEQLKTSDNPSEVWLRQIASSLRHGGWTTECRRKWNQSRGLIQRIDQMNYFQRSGALTNLGKALVESWNIVVAEYLQKNENGEPSVLFVQFHPDDKMLLNSELKLFIAYLSSIYDDACEPAHVGVTHHHIRIHRNLVEREIFSGETTSASLNTVSSVAINCQLIEEALRRAYEKTGSEPTILNALHQARQITRVLDVNTEYETLDYLLAREESDERVTR